jgi:hypothetical protein
MYQPAEKKMQNKESLTIDVVIYPLKTPSFYGEVRTQEILKEVFLVIWNEAMQSMFLSITNSGYLTNKLSAMVQNKTMSGS